MPQVKNEMNQKTNWHKETSLLDSEWGKITYGEWCEREAARMRRNGGNVRVRRKDGMVCIAVA